MQLGDAIQPSGWRRPSVVLGLIGMILIAGIVVAALFRDRVVNTPQWQVSVTGHAEVEYQPDTANVSLGVQLNKAASAEAALKDLNQRTEKIISAVKAAGIAESDIQTHGFSIFSHYDYIDNTSVPAGYDASQQLLIKVRDIAGNKDLVSRVVTEATKAGANQVNDISFEVSNAEDLKQQARLEAIADAKQKAGTLANAAGVQLKKVIGWWDNVIQAPGLNQPMYYDGKGAGGAVGGVGGAVPIGVQKIIIEIGVNYRIK